MPAQLVHPDPDSGDAFRIERKENGESTVRRYKSGPLDWLVSGMLVLVVVVTVSNLGGVVARGEVTGFGNWLLLVGGSAVIAAVFWSAYRKRRTRLEMGTDQIVVRNIWRTYRVDLDEVSGLGMGYTVWLTQTGVLETRSGRRLRINVLDVGWPGRQRSTDEMRKELVPIAELLGFDRVD